MLLLIADTHVPKRARDLTERVWDEVADRAVGARVDLLKGGAMAFDLGSVNGFVHRTDAPPLPKFQVREMNGVIEVFAPTKST